MSHSLLRQRLINASTTVTDIGLDPDVWIRVTPPILVEFGDIFWHGANHHWEVVQWEMLVPWIGSIPIFDDIMIIRRIG